MGQRAPRVDPGRQHDPRRGGAERLVVRNVLVQCGDVVAEEGIVPRPVILRGQPEHRGVWIRPLGIVGTELALVLCSVAIPRFILAKQTAGSDDTSTVESTAIGTLMGTAAASLPPSSFSARTVLRP